MHGRLRSLRHEREPGKLLLAERTSDTDCGLRGACIDLACADGETTRCGPLCLPRCDSDDDCQYGTCSIPPSSETMVRVCYPL